MLKNTKYKSKFYQMITSLLGIKLQYLQLVSSSSKALFKMAKKYICLIFTILQICHSSKNKPIYRMLLQIYQYSQKLLIVQQFKQFQSSMQSQIETYSRTQRNNDHYLQLTNEKKEDSLINYNYDSEISPWNSEQYTKISRPILIDHTIQKQTSSSKRLASPRKKVISNSLTISKDFFHLLKRQKRESSSLSPQKQTLLKMKRVNVNLDEQVLSRPFKKYGRTIQIDNKNSISPQRSIFKEQPVRMKILKRILHKNVKQSEAFNAERDEQSSTNCITSRGRAINQRQLTVLPAVFQHMLRDYGLNSKLSNLYKYGYDFLPKVEENKGQPNKQISPFLCQGQIISKQDFYSKKRAKLKHYHLKDKSKGEKEQKLLFLEQFQAQV